MVKIRNLEKRRNKFQGKVISTWIITYICLFLVLLSLWATVAGISQNMIKKQNQVINQTTLNILVSSLDENFGTIEKLVAQLGINKQVMRKSHHQFTLDGFDAYSSKEIMDEIQKSKVGNPYIDDIYLYLPNSSYVISTTSVSMAKIYFDEHYASVGLMLDDWENLMKEKHIISYNSVKKNEKYDSILLLQTVPSSAALKNSKSQYATLAVKINIEAIRRLAEDFAHVNSVEINIYDEEKNLLVNAEGVFHKNIVQTFVVDSDRNHWTYEMNIPFKVYFRDVYYLVIFMIIALFISFLVFMLLSVYFTRKNYSPLRELLEQVKEYRVSDSFDGSEYMYLHESFEHIVEEQRRDKKMLLEQMEKIRVNYLCRFLTGGMRRADVDSKVFANLQLEWILEPCLIMVIKAQKDWEEQKSVRELAISLGIGQKAEDIIQGYSVILNKMLVVIMRCDDDLEMQKQKLINYGNQMNQGDNIYYLAISRFDQNKSIANAYDEAIYALQYAEYVSLERVVIYDDINVEKNPTKYCYVDEWVLGDAIKKQDQKETLQLMGQVWKANTENRHLRMSDMRFLLALQLSSYFKTVCMLYPEFYQNGFPVDLRKISELDSKEKMSQMLEQVIEASFDKMTKYSVENKEERLKLEVMQYIEENFKNSELTVEMLCRDFGKSVPYFSKLFKGISGEGLLYYINSRRIQEAKYLIKNDKKDCNVNDISALVGFTNVNSFIRIFKKYEGITPGKYREIVQKMDRKV